MHKAISYQQKLSPISLPEIYVSTGPDSLILPGSWGRDTGRAEEGINCTAAVKEAQN